MGQIHCLIIIIFIVTVMNTEILQNFIMDITISAQNIIMEEKSLGTSFYVI